MAPDHSQKSNATSWLHIAQRMQNFIRTLLVITALKALAMTSSAVVLDWNNLPVGQPWTNGSLSNSFDVDATNAGNDITVGVVSNGVTLATGYPQNAVSATIAGGDASYLRLNTTAGMVNSSNSVSVTITFNYALGVNNVTLSLLDIDATADTESGTGYIDRISAISATPLGGPANSVALTGTNTSNVVTTLTGSGTLGMEVQGNVAAGNISTHNGDVTFTSDGTPITSITFTWNNPGPDYFNGQIIALGNITFTAAPVPEIGSSFGALATCGGLLAAWRRRPARQGLAAA